MRINEELNKNISNIDDHVVIAVPRGWIKELVETHFACELTEEEFDDLSVLVWEDENCRIEDRIIETIQDILNQRT